MADGQELDNLLIKVDSELGDLKGLTSAIDALQRLANFTKDASSGIKQIGQLGKAFHEFDNLKLDGLDEASRGVRNLVGALDDLSKVGNVTKKTFNQFGQLGKTLRDNFDGLGQSLQGIQEVAVGVNNLVSALRGLSQVTGVTKSAINSLGGVGDALHHFKGVDAEIAKLVTPVKELMTAIGQLGNNNKISIRIDNSGIAHVNQVLKNTRKQIKDANDWWKQTSNDRKSIDLSKMFDISQPTADLERNLSRAQRMIVTYENQTRTSLEKLHNMQSNFSMADLVNNQQFRNAFRSHMISDKMVEQIRQGIDRVSTELETRGAQRIEDAWRHTQEAIVNDSQLDLSRLIDTNLPVEEVRANLRTLQNELSRAESAMNRAYTNLHRLRSRESDENVLRGSQGYRDSAYTYATNAQFVRQYRDAIESLNSSLREMERLSQSDVALLRELPQLQQQLTRYQGTLDTLLANDDTSLEGQRTIDAFVRGVDYLEDRIREIQEQLGHVPETTEGVLETMRQVADEAERTARATAETAQNMRNSIGQGFSSFGGMLSGTGNPILGSLGNLSSMFGKAVQNGTAQLSGGALASLQGVASTLGTIATAMSQVVAVAGVFVAVFKTWWSLMSKAKDSLDKFVQGLKQFAKDMLTKVVGAFNAVSGAVSKVASAVRSGAEIVVSALRKIGEFGEKVISVFARFGSFLGTVGKGAKAIANLITPKAVKNLASFNGSLKNIVKNTHLLNKAIQVANKWFTMLTRMLMRKIVQAFISNMKDAFDQLVVWEMKANDEMLRLNLNVSKMYSGLLRTVYQLVAVFEPLINAIATPVETFLDGMASVGENLAKFMAILTGQPYYLRVNKFFKNYGEQVEETSKKVKNLTNGLDELNILNDKKDEIGGFDITDYIEKVPVDGSLFGLPSLREILEAIKDWLRNIDWEKIKSIVRDFIHRLMVLINEILKDLELWGLFGDTLAQIFNTLMEAWNQFITDFDPVATEKALSELIVRALNGIDWDLIHENVELTAKKFAQFWNEVFKDKALWNSITTTITNFLNEIVHYFDTWAWTFDFKQMADTLTGAITDILTGFDYEQLRHAVEGWVTGIVDFINQAVSDKQFWKTLGDSFANIINSTLIQALKDLTKLNFVELSDSIKLAIEHAIDGIHWDDLKASIEQLAENLTKGINDFFGDEEFLTKVTTAFANIGNIILGAIRKSLETLGAKDIGNAIGTAIINGLKKVDWETVFLLPAEALNALSNAIRGLFDSIPEDFNLGTWLAEHFSLTLESIDWETIERNVESFVQMVTDTINGLLSNDRFWNNVNITLDKVLKITIKLLDPIVNIDGEKLGQRIAELVNTFVQSNTIKTLIADAGKVFMNLVVAVDVALNGIEWEQMGQQIADGIIEAVNNIWKNKNKIAKMIKDAFKSFSTLVEAILKKMIDANAFKKLGEILGTIGLAVIEGMATFFEQNTDRIIQAMRQFGDSLANFITTHEDEIVNGLNKIIDGIVAIIDEFFNDKSKFNQAVNRVIKRLNLGKLVGMFIEKILTAFASKLNRLDAIWDAIIAHLDDFVAEIKKGLKRVAKALWNKLAGVLSDVFWGTLEEFAKGTGNEPLFFILQLRKLLTGNEDGSIDFLDIVKGIFFKNEDTAKESFMDKVKNKLSDFWDNMPWNKGKAQEVPVTIDPVVEDATLEDFELEGATVSKISASRLVVKTYEGETLTVDEMFADVLTLTDILADKLKVKELEVEGKDELNGKDLPNYFGANSPNAQGGTLSKDAEFEKITAKLLEITEKITAPLLEVEEKVTAPLLEIAEKIIAKLLEIKEKVTTPLLEAMQIVTPLLNVTDLRVANITATTINANLLNVADILANTLRVGTIEGQLSGGTSGGISGGSYPVSIGSFTLPSYDGWENIYSDIQMPNFAVGERWSDISGAVPSAEDFLVGLDNTYSDVVNGVTTAYNELPRYLGGSGSTASGGTLSKNGATGLSAFDRKMADTLAGAKINNLPSNAEYIRDYLMGFIGNEAGVYGLMGNLYAESGLLPNNLEDIRRGEGVTKRDIDYTNSVNHGANFLDGKGYGLAQWTTDFRKQAYLDSLNGRSVDDINAQLEFLKSEIMSPEYKNFYEKLKNASSIEEASDATLYDFERPTKKDESVAGLRLAYGQDIAGQLGSYDGEVNIEDEETPTSDGMENFDEVNIIGGKPKGGSNPLSFLDSLPLQTEYLMAQVYDIIDKWLGRIWKLFKSFKVDDFLNGLLNLNDIDDIFDSEILKDIRDALEEIAELLKKLLEDGIKSVEDTRHLDLNTDAKSENTRAVEALTDAIHDWIDCASNTGHLDNNTDAKSKNTKAVEKLNNAIGSLGNRLSNIKCDCDCNCCNGCNSKGGGSSTPSGGISKGGGSDIKGTPSSPISGATTIKDEPTPTSGTPTGIRKGTLISDEPVDGVGRYADLTNGCAYVSGTSTGKPSGGQGNIDLKMPYGNVPMYALIDGKLVRLNDNLPDSVKKLVASGKVPITDAQGNRISSDDRSTMLGYLKGKGWLGDVDNDWLDNLRQSATNIKSDLLTPWENDITNQDKKDTYYQAKDLTDKLRQDGLSESEYKDTYDKLKQLATDSGLSGDKYADSATSTTYNKDLEDYLANSNVNESGDGGWLTNPANDTSEEKKEYGVNTLDTQYRTDPDSKTDIQDTIDKIKEKQEKEDKGSKGAGTSKYDKESGITTYYDADGNEKGTYNTKTGEYSGDTIYARLSKAEKEKADKWKSTHIPNVKTGEIVDKDGNVTGHLDGNWGGKYWKDGKEYANEAEYQKQLQETDYGKAKKYWNMISQAYMVLNKQDKGDLEKVYQDAYKVYTQMTRPVSTEKQNELAKQLISIAENAGIDLSKSAYENAMKFKKDTKQTDANSKLVAGSSFSSKASTGTVTKDSGTSNISSDMKSAIDATNSETSITWKNGAKTLFDYDLAKRDKQAYALAVKTLNANLGQTVSKFKSGSVFANAKTGAKEAFDYWYKNSFLVKGYQMGGTPNSGELYMARENGSNEFIGSFGNKSVVANNEQIVTAVANGVSMANDRVVSAIQSQTGSLENAIDRKNLDVQIGDRQIAEANRRGEKGLGGNMVQ